MTITYYCRAGKNQYKKCPESGRQTISGQENFAKTGCIHPDYSKGTYSVNSLILEYLTDGEIYIYV